MNMNNEAIRKIEEEYRKLQELNRFISKAANDIPARRDKAKGKVRLRWNHKVSTNVSQYRIEKMQTASLREYSIEPNPVQLTYEQLWNKI